MQATRSPKRRALGVAARLGVIHALVDACCAALLAAGTASGSFAGSGESPLFIRGLTLWDVLLTYNALAFGTQFAFGAAADRWQCYRVTAVAGLIALTAALGIASVAPPVAVVAAGLGNAAFHVGAAGIVLRLAPHHAAPAGVFVAPGALGLVVGAWCGRNLVAWPWIGAALLVVGIGAVAALNRGQSDAHDEGLALGGRESEATSTHEPRMSPLLVLCLVVLLGSVAIRSAGGLAVGVAFDGQAEVLWGLAVAACAGKAAGGFLGDRFGWTRTSVVALLLCAPLLSWGVHHAAAAIAGTVLFQMAMPITLMAVFRVFPREPGLAFGLTTLALLLGAVPLFLLPPQSALLADPSAAAFALAAMALASAAALLATLPPILRARRS